MHLGRCFSVPGYTALSGINESTGYTNTRRFLKIGIFKYDVLALPPGSIPIFLSSSPHRFATCQPASVLPVSVTARISGFCNTASILLLFIRSVLNTPAGNHAFLKIASTRKPQPGTIEECFSAAAKRNTCQKGKFQGITPRMIPRGIKTTLLFPPPVSICSGWRNRSAL